MNLRTFADLMTEWAKTSPDAEVLVDGWPVYATLMPAYYDGPSKRFDEATNTMSLIRSGTKVQLSALGMDYYAWRCPDMKFVVIGGQDSCAEWYRAQFAEAVAKEAAT